MIILPKLHVDAGEDLTNSIHCPQLLLFSNGKITGKHSGCVMLLFDRQQDIELPLRPMYIFIFTKIITRN